MKIQVSSDLLDGLVLALLDKQDYYGYSLTQDMQGQFQFQNQHSTQYYEG